MSKKYIFTVKINNNINDSNNLKMEIKYSYHTNKTQQKMHNIFRDNKELKQIKCRKFMLTIEEKANKS